jgi:hypothetical protein
LPFAESPELSDAKAKSERRYAKRGREASGLRTPWIYTPPYHTSVRINSIPTPRGVCQLRTHAPAAGPTPLLPTHTSRWRRPPPPSPAAPPPPRPTPPRPDRAPAHRKTANLARPPENRGRRPRRRRRPLPAGKPAAAQRRPRRRNASRRRRFPAPTASPDTPWLRSPTGRHDDPNCAFPGPRLSLVSYTRIQLFGTFRY